MLIGVGWLRSSMPAVLPGYVAWQGNYSKIGSFLVWTLGDATEPGYAHSALACGLMLLGGYAAHRAQRRRSRWTGFPVTSGTGLFISAVGSGSMGLVLSNLAWGGPSTFRVFGSPRSSRSPRCLLQSYSFTAPEDPWF
ncbi:MAG: hypothetical protein ACJ74F_27475 [Mycobacterium sp.]